MMTMTGAMMIGEGLCKTYSQTLLLLLILIYPKLPDSFEIVLLYKRVKNIYYYLPI